MTETQKTQAPAEEEFDFSGSMGADVAQDSIRSGGSFNRTEFFGLDASPDGQRRGKDQALVRFLTEYQVNPEDPSLLAWITTLQHAQVPTKPKPSDLDEGRSWPQTVSCICRRDKIFRAKYQGQCYVCENVKKRDGKAHTPSNRIWALGVLREQVYGDGSEELGGAAYKGKIVGVRDVEKEVAVLGEDGKPVEGKTEMVKAYVKMNMGWKNFFQPLSALAGYYGTVLDRDYVIKRTGTGPNDTEYAFIPMDPIRLEGGEVFDLRNKELRDKYYGDAPDLRKEIASQVSDDYYNRFIIPGEQQSGGGSNSGNGQGATPAPAPPASEPDKGRMDSLRNRVAGYGQAGGGEQATAGSGGGRAL